MDMCLLHKENFRIFLCQFSLKIFNYMSMYLYFHFTNSIVQYGNGNKMSSSFKDITGFSILSSNMFMQRARHGSRL